MSSSGPDLEHYANAVERAGKRYGMSLHWGKTQAMSVGTTQRLRKPDGTEFEDEPSLKYLGGLISSSGRSDSEVSRKIGMAVADFKQLQRLWGHTGVTTKWKLRFFYAFVVSRLQYGLASLWLVTAQRRSLDGFYARCLRRILRIPVAFVRRISNKTVLARAGVVAFSEQLLKHQLDLLRRAAVAPEGSPMRRDTFMGDTTCPQIGRFVRVVGRPRQEWTSQLLREGSHRVGPAAFAALLSDRSLGADKRWKSCMAKFVAVRP